jgi:energy-coupling factor transporter transmembrane protein EcfT
VSENPFQSPQTDLQAVGVKSGKQEDVRAVAVNQKGILVCILLQILVPLLILIVFVAIRQPVLTAGPKGEPEVNPVFTLVAMVIGLVGLVFVFRLSMRVYSTAVGALLAILTLVPLLGLIVLVMVNGKATKILRQNGHHVGLLGANLAEF